MSAAVPLDAHAALLVEYKTASLTNSAGRLRMSPNPDRVEVTSWRR